MTVTTPERDPFEPRLARHASGLLRVFNEAGVIAAADVHVARRLAALAGESAEAVLLAVALAVRGPRLGHVHVDLAAIRDTAAVDAEDAVDLATLPWPEPAEWTATVAASPLVSSAPPTAPGPDGEARPLRLAGTWLYLDRYWVEEVDVAAALRAMSARATTVDDVVLAEGLARLFAGEGDGRQARAAAAAVRRRFAVVAGGPGTGKTTTVARIVALIAGQAQAAAAAPLVALAPGERPIAARAPMPLVAHAPGERPIAARAPMPLVALAAPTGKAAARLQEAVHDEARRLEVDEPVRDLLLALEATTIHRLLGWRPQSASRFRHDRNQRLPHDLVIVDESSMVSLSLMARLIEALRADARLVLVGDPGQLASIEAGAVLGDIVGAGGDGVADGPLADGIVVLDRVHRFGGTIARLATAIRAGDADQAIALLRGGDDGDGDGDGDVTWIEADVGTDEAPAAVRVPALAAARAMIDAARRGEAAAALTALGSFRILCAHRRGPYGVATWTARMEAWLQAAVDGFDAEDRWYVGRPLLVGENDYELRLNNGDTGVIVARGGDRVAAAFERAGAIVDYSPSRLSAVDTVYAMTIHKSQGSQFDAAAVLLPDPGSRLLTRELLYTAATRARTRLIVVGTEETVRAAVGRPVARASGLGRRLHGAPDSA